MLSENGESSPSFCRISEVAQAATEQFLVRSRIDCLTDVTDKSCIRTLDKGTVLVVKGTARVTSKHSVEKYLHCTDKQGLYVYLNYETSGVFSPFAGPLNISGVHTMHSLLKSFRLPCTVRVVSGKIPRDACDENKPGVFRLLELRKEKTAMLAPLAAKQMLIPTPLKVGISFYPTANMNELSKHFIFNQILDTCTRKVEQYLTSMQVIISSRDLVPRTKVKSQEEENNLFEDVDEIYPYIRKGGIPPRMTRAQSLDSDTLFGANRPNIYSRSKSQPVLGCRERSASLIVPQLVKQHTISSSTTETTFQFQSTSDCLTLGKTDVLRQFIEKYTSRESLDSNQHQSVGSSNDDIYFTLENSDNSPQFSSVKDILLPENVIASHRG